MNAQMNPINQVISPKTPERHPTDIIADADAHLKQAEQLECALCEEISRLEVYLGEMHKRLVRLRREPVMNPDAQPQWRQ